MVEWLSYSPNNPALWQVAGGIKPAWGRQKSQMIPRDEAGVFHAHILQSISLQGWEWICLSAVVNPFSPPLQKNGLPPNSGKSILTPLHSSKPILTPLGKSEGGRHTGGTEHLFSLSLWSLIKLTSIQEWLNGWVTVLILLHFMAGHECVRMVESQP